MVAGVILSGQATPCAWLPYMPPTRLAQSAERQVVRWLDNERIDYTSLYGPAVMRALRHWGPHVLKLALDTSLLFNRYCMIRISILFRGRAVPLVTRVIKHASAQVSTEQLKPILAEARGIILAAGISKVRFLADRGFCDVDLMDLLSQCGWSYIIRIKSSLLLCAAGGQRLCKVGEVSLQVGEVKCFHNIRLTGQKYGPVHVALARPAHTQEVWQVVSNEPTNLDTLEAYSERFGIEESFLDDKSGLFQLEESKFRDEGKLERLCLILSFATLFLATEGDAYVAEGKRRLVDPHWERGISYLKIGMNRVKQALSWGQKVFHRVALVGGPDPEPLGKRKKKCPDPFACFNRIWTLVSHPLS